MAAQEQYLTPATGARVIAQPFLDGGSRVDAVAPAGSSIAEIVALALPGATPGIVETYVRVTIGQDVVPREYWERVRPKPGAVVVVHLIPGRSTTIRAVLSIAVAVAAVALGQIYAAPLAGAIGFGVTPAFAGGLITATTLIAGTLLVNALVPLRRDQAQSGGPASSPTYQITGQRNVANPDGVFPYVMGDVVFAPPMAALPYTEAANGATYLRELLLLGPGPLEISDIRIAETPIEKYKDLEIEVYQGVPADPAPSLYPSQVLEERKTVVLKNAVGPEGPYTFFTARDAAECEIEMLFPSGLAWFVTVGNPPITYPFPLTVNFNVSYRLNGVGAWTPAPTLSCYGFSRDSLTFSQRVAFAARGQYEIRIERATADLEDLNAFDTSHQYVSISTLSAIRSFRPESPINYNVPLALIGLRIKASQQLNGVIDTLTCRAQRICLDWDAGTQTWIERATNNPASVLRWAMQGPAMAYPLSDDEIDLEGLAAWHEFCAAKALTFNRVLDYEASVFDVWQDIAAAGRAFVRDDGEKWGVVIDAPKDIIVQHVTPRNSWDFAGSRDYVQLPDAFSVSFFDETNRHKPPTRIVPRPGFAGAPAVIESISFPGVTNPAQVYREARRRFRELLYRRDTFTAMMDFEGAVARQGDLVILSHDVLINTQAAARVTAVDTGWVSLDSTIMMRPGVNYTIRFRTLATAEGQPDQSIKRKVRGVTAEMEVDTLYFIGAGDLPNVGDLAMVGEVGREEFECVVKEVEGAENLARRLTLLLHAPEITTETDAEVPPPWTGRVGETGEAESATSLDFSEPNNSQNDMDGWI